VNAVFGRELGDGFGFLQHLQDNLGFEGGSVRLFHMRMVPDPGRQTVQILGSIIQSGRACSSISIAESYE
jgi:hypothetical protein